MPVSFSTPVPELYLPVIPFRLENPSASWLAASPELIVTVALARVVASGELTVSLEVTGTAGVPAS